MDLYNELYHTLGENTLGKRLKKARLKLRLSQEQLAKNCGLSTGAITGYEYDLINPSKDALIKLGRVIDLDYLCCDEYSKFILSNYISILKKWRKDNGLSMRKAAKILEIPPSTYISWEKGVYGISKNSYHKLKEKINI
ncbi:helix-turn-helix transcriptional regulator [Clostridium cochlearium]|uniref:helix-turn-helix transcriptional regulator n=1 Tax=Clostridium cochlearium TaxID=1494 RepID=UPI0034505081